MLNDRPNTEATRIAENGLHLLRADGVYVAAHFMLEHGVRIRVIGRVLAAQTLRRQGGDR